MHSPDPAPRVGPREVLGLAVPAFLALVAEPLFLMVDAAVVGRLGVVPLAGLGAASSVLLTAAGVFVFLAYGTTASVARLIGAGHPRRALTVGVDGCWLAVVLGLVLAMLGWVLAEPLIRALGARGMAASHAVDYLHASLPGLPGMLLVLAASAAGLSALLHSSPMLFEVLRYLGVAYLAGLQAGLYRDLDEIASHWHRQQRFAPRMADAHRGKLYAGWLDAVKRVRSEG